jgi:CBS domain-containing protein
VDPWKERPHVYELLKRTSVKELVEPIPQPLLHPAVTLRDVGRAFVEHGNEFFLVSKDGQTLDGVVTITDLIRCQNGSPETLLGEFMTRNPVTVSAEDDCAIATNAFREYRLKTLPVVENNDTRKLAGCIRMRRLMAFSFKELSGKEREQETADRSRAQ